jgi:PAS domain S-box-containing protein
MNNQKKTKTQLIQALEKLQCQNIQLETALRGSQEKMKAIMKAPTETILLLKLNDEIVEANEATALRLGMSKEKLIGKNMKDLLPLDIYQPRRRYIDQVCQSGKSARFEDSRKGQWFDHVFYPLFNDQGEVTMIGIVSHDITERKKAEESLKQSEKHFRLLSENTSDVIWMMDVTSQKFTYVSPSVIKLRGYTPEEVMSQPVSESLTPESLKKINDLLALRIPEFLAGSQTPSFFTTEVDQPCKDGSVVQTEVTTTSLLNDRGSIEIIGVTRDISERKKAENALKNSEKNLRLLSNRLINAQEKEQRRIAIELHDDLGQSLVGLKMLLRSMQNKLESHQVQLKETIQKAADSVDRMTNNIRHLSKDLHPSVLDHVGIIEALEWLLEDIEKTHKIKIKKPNPLPKVSISKKKEFMIFRIFQEALTNILKHAEATEIFVEWMKEGRKLTFLMTDNGKGFNLKEVQEKKSFERGLGLIAMKERAQLAGGDFEIKSESGKGTLISFWIPCFAGKNNISNENNQQVG